MSIKSWEFVTVGDPHIDKMEGLFPFNHLILQYNELRKPFEYALKMGVPNVVVLGDVAHRDRLSEEGRIMLYELLLEYDGKLNIYVILGNHDVAREGIHSLQFFVKLYETGKFKTVHIISKKEQHVFNGVPVNFLPFPHKKSIPCKGMDRVLNFAHLERPGALRDNGVKIQKGHGVKQKDKDIWVVGHLHTPQHLASTYFSGTLYQTNFGESLPKSFIHGRIRVKGRTLVETIKVIPNDPAFKLFNLKIEKKSDLKQIEKNPLYLYKVFVKSGTKIDVDLMARYPNIQNVPVMYDTDADLAKLEVDTVEEIPTYTLYDGLKAEMKKRGASLEMRKRGRQLVGQIIHERDNQTKVKGKK